MIQPNELRIRSLVKLTYEEYHDLEEDGILNDKNNIFEIRKIDNDGDIEIYNEIENLYEFQHNENIEPIPLTEEWLIKFGFEKIGYNFRKCEDHGYGLGITEFIIWFNTYKKTYSIKAINILVEIKTVHRLQNLYFALTGKELQQTNNQNLNGNEPKNARTKNRN